MLKETIYASFLSVAFLCSLARAQSLPINPGDENALHAATDGLCHRQIAMLGESATHGDGHTLAFKVALVEQLVDHCGFDSVFFEASYYEFIHLNRRLRMGDAVSAGDLLAAVGGLWEFNREFQPLAPFLLAKAKAGQVFLGGIDDQLGQRGQDYANVKMVTELTNLLSEQKRRACNLALHRRIYNDYPDSSPYSRSERSQIETCLAEARRANFSDEASDREERAERQEMISAARRWISRDFQSDAEVTVNRDRSMFEDFEWLLRQQRGRHKVIVWSATVHVARQRDPVWGDRLGTNFGSFVHRKYGHRSFSLGFSALTGSFQAVGQHGVLEMPAAPPNSVEARALAGNHADAVYIESSRLAAMGIAPGAFFVHSWQKLPWSIYLDGAVVFREERPPSRVGGK